MDCEVCGKVLLPSRAVFNCSCGALTHAYCWEKHVFQSHRPRYTLVYVDLNGKVQPKQAVNQAGKWSEKKIPVTAGKPTERDAGPQRIDGDISLGALGR